MAREDRVSTESRPEVSVAEEPVTEVTQEEEITFPRTINNIIFNTPEELRKYATELQERLKSVKSVVKAVGGSATRTPSAKKLLIEALCKIINENMSDETKEKLGALTENTKISIHYDVTEKVFTIPTPKTREGGSGGKGGSPMTVDGKDYPSAKAARETLYPDEKGKQKNRQSTIAFLKSKNHTVTE